MNTIDTANNSTNIVVYLMTVTGTFLTENWYLVGMFIFGLAHVLIAIQKNQREKELHAIKIKALEAGAE